MITKHLAVSCLLAGVAFTAQAQVVLSEGFDSLSSALSSGWTAVNRSPQPGATWLQGNPLIFTASTGAANAYATAGFLGTFASAGPISNWLITPRLTLDPTSTISFDVRVIGEGFLDTVNVLVSTTGTASSDFTQVGSYGSSVDAGWVARSFSANLASSTLAYVAFVYSVDDVAVAGDYLGLDNVSITAVPEPASLTLMGLGIAALAALAARRRQTA